MSNTETLIPAGLYQAKAQWWELGETASGKEQICVLFSLMSPAEYLGRTIAWYGFFTEKTLERTIESMRACGWTGIDLDNLAGMDANEVSIVVEHETYEGVTSARVRWVNAPGGGLKNVMDPVKKKSFAQQMRGAIAGLAQGKPTTTTARPPARPAANNGRPPEPPPHTDADAPGDIPF